MSPQDLLTAYENAKKRGDEEAVKLFEPVLKEYLRIGDVFATAPAPEAPKSSSVLDIPLGVAKGAVTGIRFLADTFGADNPISKTLIGAEDYLASLYSAGAKQDQQEIARILKDAEDKGVLDQVIAGLKAFTVAPADLLAQALGTAAPAVVGGLLGTAARLGVTGVRAIQAGTGAAMGAGMTKSNIYTAVKEELEKAGVDSAVAEKQAVLAQEYGGQNLDQIILGAGLGGVAAVGPLEKVLTRIGARQGATKLEEGVAARGLGRRIVEGGAKEALPEAAQAGQEQLAQNIALQREGFDVPTFRGVAGQATLEGLAGLGLGTVSGALDTEKEAPPPRPPQPPIPTEAQEAMFTEEEAPLQEAADIRTQRAQEEKTKAEDIENLRVMRDQYDVLQRQAESLQAKYEAAQTAEERQQLIEEGQGLVNYLGEPIKLGAREIRPTISGLADQITELDKKLQLNTLKEKSFNLKNQLDALNADMQKATTVEDKNLLDERIKRTSFDLNQTNERIDKFDQLYKSSRAQAPAGQTSFAFEEEPAKPFAEPVEVPSAAVEPTLETDEGGREIPTGPVRKYAVQEDGTYAPAEEGGPANTLFIDQATGQIQMLTPEGERVKLTSQQQKTARDSVSELYEQVRGQEEKLPAFKSLSKQLRQVFLKALAVGFRPESAVSQVAMYRSNPEAYLENFGPIDQITPPTSRTEKRTTKRLVAEEIGLKQTEAETGIRRQLLSALDRVGVVPTPKIEADQIVGIEQPKNIKINQVLFRDTSVLPANRSAQYDPDAKRVDVRLDDRGQINLESEELAHELTHAGTVEVLNTYENNPELLTNEQREAAENIFNLLEEARRLIKDEQFQPALENVYEFVAYALNNQPFQARLARTKVKPELVKYTKDRSLWSALSYAIQRLLGITDPEGNVLLEVSESFKRILKAPIGGVKMAPLPMQAAAQPAAQPAGPKKAQMKSETADEVRERLKQTLVNKRPSLSTIGNYIKKLFGNYGAKKGLFTDLVRYFQNEREELKTLEDFLERSGQVDYTSDKKNAIATFFSQAKNFAINALKREIEPLQRQVADQIRAIMDAKKMDENEVLGLLHTFVIGQHDNERRLQAFLQKVPLEPNADTQRQVIYETVAMKQDTPHGKAFADLWKKDKKAALKQIEQLRNDLHRLVGYDAAKNEVTDFTNHKYPNDVELRNFKMPNYDALGYSYQVAEQFKKDLSRESREVQTAFKDLYAAIKELQEVTNRFNKDSNYASPQTDSVIAFYDWKNYMPFKGKPPSAGVPSNLEISGEKISGDFVQGDYAFGGRDSDADNPILQALVDARRSAVRYGYRDVAIATKNVIDLLGKNIGKKVKTISFADRYLDKIQPQDLVKENAVFIYNDDGSIDIYEINDPTLRNAIKGTFQAQGPFDSIIDSANTITSAMGKMHTRWNPAFAPWDFTRNLFTYAGIVGLEKGGKAAANVLTSMANIVARGGFQKTFKFSQMYANGKFDELEKLAARDPYYKDILDYFELGGKVAYVDALNSARMFEKTAKELAAGKRQKYQENATQFMDSWMDMFELSSRIAAFRTMRDQYFNEMMKDPKGKSEAEIRKAADIRAANYAKELANFEEVGKYGREIGAWFMFFRPAATGSVRAIKALAPAFSFVGEKEFKEYYKSQTRYGGEKLTDNQLDAMYERYNKERKMARVMSTAIMGIGFFTYMMAYMMSGEDDQKRNKVGTDDMARWVRALRINTGIDVNGRDLVLQLPWGFGSGALASAGSQVAALFTGGQSFMPAISNIADAAFESFMPIQTSRIDKLENPTGWFIDSITPSALKPFVQFTMNVDGLGRRIYPDRQTSRYADAYMSTDNVPSMYSDIARWWLSNTGMDVSPNSIYFFANNYIDGLAKAISTTNNLVQVAAGNKDFDPRTDTYLLDSYLKAPSNYDAIQFKKVEKEVIELSKRLKSLEGKPEYAEFVRENPIAPALVAQYNKFVNGGLRNINQAMNTIRRSDTMTAKEKEDQLQLLRKTQNLLKSSFTNSAQQYMEIKPD